MNPASAGTRGENGGLVSRRDLEAFACTVLDRIGLPLTASSVVAEQLVEADLAGCYSHGVALLPWYEELVTSGDMDPAAETEVLWESGAMVGLDGHNGVGQVCAALASELAIGRAQEHGISCVLGRNAGHLGRLGHFTTRIARAGCASVLTINYQGGMQTIAPYGALDARLSNDPISIGAPSRDAPVVADMALSAAARVKIDAAGERCRPIPEGWVMDGDGKPSTDPGALERGGTMLPLGGLVAGHKGYGLVVLIDILTGLLSGGGACNGPPTEQFSNAFCLIAIDVARATSRGDFEAEVEAFRAYVKSARRRPGGQDILFPGELETSAAERQEREGISLDRHIWGELGALARRLETPLPYILP